MASVPFIKAQAAGNDFLIVERRDLLGFGSGMEELAQLAADLCDRRFGVGADGLEVLSPPTRSGAVVSAHLWNSDGSEAEISGNGTRCVAAGIAARGDGRGVIRIETGAGLRDLELISRNHPHYRFRMITPEGDFSVVAADVPLAAGGRNFAATLVDVGNPQCVCRVDSFDFDWRAAGARIECHTDLPSSTNVSFVRVLGEGDCGAILEVRFWERGAGATLSSGTGSLGAAVAARRHGWVGESARIATQGGAMTVDWLDGLRLTGDATIICQGRYDLGARQGRAG